MRNILLVCAMLMLSPLLQAAEFAGRFDGCDEGLVALNGKTYPRRLDISADYRGRLVRICRIPAGTHVTYALENLEGVGTVVSIVITDVSAELDQLFPPR
jgi:hypothetical protein